MTPAEKAYATAEDTIAKAKLNGWTTLDFHAPKFRALETLPPQIADLTQVTEIDLRTTQVNDIAPLQGMTAMTTLALSNTQVSDIAPLQGMTAMTRLFLSNTQVSDIAPLQGLTAMTTLTLTNTQVSDIAPLQGMTAMTTLFLDNTLVSDLRPIKGMKLLADQPEGAGLKIKGIPALALDPVLADCAEIKDRKERGQRVLARLEEIGDNWPPVVDGPKDTSAAPTYVLEDGQPMRAADEPPNEGDEDQQDLHDDVKAKAQRLIDEIGPSNQFARLKETALTYQAQVDKPMQDIRLKRLWSAANTLRNAYHADDRATETARMNDELPPLIGAALKDLVETHGLFIMGFPQAQQIETTMRSYTQGPRNPDEREAAQQIASALQGQDNALDPDEQAALNDDALTANSPGPDGAMAEASLSGRLWNMLGAWGRKARTALKWGAAAAVGGAIGNYFTQFVMANEVLIATYLKLAQGAASGWFQGLVTAIRAMVGG